MLHGNPSLHLTMGINVKYANGTPENQGVEKPGYVVPGVSWNPQRIHGTYQSGFAIESSYRMRNLVKPRTSTCTSADPIPLRYRPVSSYNPWMVVLWIRASP
jgi:putative transposase